MRWRSLLESFHWAPEGGAVHAQALSPALDRRLPARESGVHTLWSRGRTEEKATPTDPVGLAPFNIHPFALVPAFFKTPWPQCDRLHGRRQLVHAQTPTALTSFDSAERLSDKT